MFSVWVAQIGTGTSLTDRTWQELVRHQRSLEETYSNKKIRQSQTAVINFLSVRSYEGANETSRLVLASKYCLFDMDGHDGNCTLLSLRSQI